MKRSRIAVLLSILAAALIFAPFSFNNDPVVKTYTVTSDKVYKTVRIALITDLHSRNFGDHQKELLDLIGGQSPDIVMLGGDIFDKDAPLKANRDFIKAVSETYPCFFVTGNNEFSTGKVPIIRSFLSSCGIYSLEGDCLAVKVNDQYINVCGVDDCKIGERALEYQLEKTKSSRSRGLFTILLAHHPEHIDRYLDYNYDLILSGHTHGGLFRIPMISNGIYAPDQGIFPKYAGGYYRFGDTSLIISRGLAKESSGIPRLFNPPELVVVDIGQK